MFSARSSAVLLESIHASQAAREIKEKQALAGEAKGPPCVPCALSRHLFREPFQNGWQKYSGKKG